MTMDLNTFLAEAILAGQTLRITYKDEERTIEPYTLGRARNGSVQLVAYQTTGDRPDWRLFSVSKLSFETVSVLDEHTEATRAGYNPRDSRMVEILSTRPVS